VSHHARDDFAERDAAVCVRRVAQSLFSALAVRLGIATKPPEYTCLHVAGAGALSGIGFIMSLFIAHQAFPLAADFTATKIAVFAASAIAAIIGVALLWISSRNGVEP
jgi:NhaA family Na+:H+ antiporter